MPFPAPKSLSDKPENEVKEIRNYLLATCFINDLVKLEHKINLDDIKDIHNIMLRDILLESYGFKDDDIQNVGEFRKAGVVAGNVHETVYPVSSSLFW